MFIDNQFAADPAWSREEIAHLRSLKINPTRSDPIKLRKLVEYASDPKTSRWGLEHGTGGAKASRLLARKILDLTRDGQLDWVLYRTPGPEFDRKIHNDLLVELGREFHKEVFRISPLFPSEIVERSLQDEWGIKASDDPLTSGHSDLMPLLVAHLDGTEQWRVLELRHKLHRAYVGLCGQLRCVLTCAILECSNTRELKLAPSNEIYLHIRQGGDPASFVDQSDGEFLTEAVSVFALDTLMASGEVLDRFRFLAARPGFSGRPAEFEVRQLSDNRVAAWWGEWPVAVINPERWPTVMSDLHDLVTKSLPGSNWRSLIEAWDLLHWNPYQPGIKEQVEDLVRSDRLASAIVRGQCSECANSAVA